MGEIMKLILRDYQEKVLQDLATEFTKGKDCVIAASPSSGKTTMAIEFIKRNPNKKFLVITHGQNVLKDMWEEEFEKYLTHKEMSYITYGLPQSLKSKDIPKVDFIIIDEAHEFTFAKMVQDILEKNKSAYKIYLTGTPSKFIEKKYPVIVVAAMDLIEKGFISDLYVGLFSTVAKIKDDDRNIDNDLTGQASKKLEKTVESDMQSLLIEMIKRLKSTGLTKAGPYRALMTNKFKAFGQMDKTMIACASVKQADKVHSYLQENGVESVLSHSENDPDSLFIIGRDGFLKNPKIKVLVVVDRGILGFNMPELVNVVDMTGSHNINRIYQLYARVMRKNNNKPNKFFFKLATKEEMHVTKFYMEAALCLMFQYFISRYNGKNLNELEVPVKIRKRVKKEDKDQKKKNLKPRQIDVPEDLFEIVSAAKILKDLYNNASNNFNEYAMIKFKEIRSDVFGDTVQINWEDLSEVLAYMKKEHGDVREKNS